MGLIERFFSRGSPAPARVEPSFETKSGETFSTTDADFWHEVGGSSSSVTGLYVNQRTSLSVAGVLAATTILSEDVAKLPIALYRREADGSKTEVTDHPLAERLEAPNEWQNWMEFCEQLQIGVVLRGNGYAVIVRNARGLPVRFVPVNPDWVSVWIGPEGEIFYRVQATDQHIRAMLAGLPELIPAEDMLHIRGFTLNGLVGASRISLAREAIALSMAQEQKAARWMSQSVAASGMLSTEQKLSDAAAKRIKQDIKDNWAGLNSAGKLILGEQGLKFVPFTLTSADMEFIASRKFQLEDVARIFRIPLHMLGELTRSTNNNIGQQAQEYVNYTLTGYTGRWCAKLSQAFSLRKQGLFVEHDFSVLLQADMTTRMNNWRTAIMSMIGKPDEARLDLWGKRPEGGEAGKLHFPQNMAAQGSQSSGTQPDGGGRPAEDDPPRNYRRLRSGLLVSAA